MSRPRRAAAGGCLLAAVLFSGCSRVPVLLERPKGQLEYRRPEILPVSIRVSPATLSESRDGVDVTVRYAGPHQLEKFFSNEEVFGPMAGDNPYPRETLVFYVRLANHSGKKIRVNPDDFVLIDNLNIQYAELSADDISALLDSRANIWSYAKTTGDLAPGPYGAPLKVAGALGGRGTRKLHYLIKQVRLSGGTVHPGIAYDGYVAFPRPHPNATSLRLLIHNIKTDFNPADEPQKAIHFEFPLRIERVEEKGEAPDS